MMRIDRKKGFTLVELLAGVIVGGIVVLMVAALGTIVYKSYNGLRNQSGVFNDSQFALQLIREGVRQSTAAPTTGSSTINIVTAACSKLNFYIQGSNLVYDYTCTNPSTGVTTTKNADTIISGVTSLVFTPNVTALPLVSVTLSGVKYGVTFNYSIYALRRI